MRLKRRRVNRAALARTLARTLAGTLARPLAETLAERWNNLSPVAGSASVIAIDWKIGGWTSTRAGLVRAASFRT